MTKFRGEMDNSIIIVADFNTLLSIMARSSQRTNRDEKVLAIM